MFDPPPKPLLSKPLRSRRDTVVELLGAALRAVEALAEEALTSCAQERGFQQTSFNLMEPDALAAELHVSEKTLAKWRSESRGPAFVKVGGKPHYNRVDVERWIAGGGERRRKPA